MNWRGSLTATGLVIASSIAAGCGGWVDIDSLPASKAGDGNGVAGAATGGSTNPTGGQGGKGASDSVAGSAARNSAAGTASTVDDDPFGNTPASFGGPAPAQTACDIGTGTGIAGTIDGTLLHEAWQLESWQWQNRVTHWSMDSQFTGRSFEYFMGGDLLHLSAPADGPQAVRIGVTRAPASSALAGQVLCFGDGGVYATNELSYDGYSNHARLLGQCPGAPVAGELTLCGSDFNGECAAPISGTLEGSSLSAGNLQLRVRDDGIVDAEADHFKLFGYTDDASPGTIPVSPSAGQLDEGFLIVYPNTPGLAPAVYCVGDSSTFDSFSSGNHVETTLRNLSKLGECRGNAGTDAVQFCN